MLLAKLNPCKNKVTYKENHINSKLMAIKNSLDK